MFGFSMGSLGIKFALLAVLATAIGGAFWHYTIVKGERNAAIAQVGALTIANEIQHTTIATQEAAISNWVEAQAKMQLTLDAMANAQITANKVAKELNNVLAKHDLHKLSLAKPNAIERRINRGTANVLRLFNTETSGGDQHPNDGCERRT